MRRNLLIAASMFSAGVHTALVPEHLEEAPVIGWSFIAASVALVVAVLWLVASPASIHAPRALAILFAAMIAAYIVTRATTIPGVDEREPVDGVGLATKAVELVGLVLAISLQNRHGAVRPVPLASTGWTRRARSLSG